MGKIECNPAGLDDVLGTIGFPLPMKKSLGPKTVEVVSSRFPIGEADVFLGLDGKSLRPAQGGRGSVVFGCSAHQFGKIFSRLLFASRDPPSSEPPLLIFSSLSPFETMDRENEPTTPCLAEINEAAGEGTCCQAGLSAA